MKRIAVAVLLLLVCAAPAFAKQKKHKDPRVGEHPKAYHTQNQHLKHPVKHKAQKHTA